VLARIADHKITELAALLLWNWRRPFPLDRAEEVDVGRVVWAAGRL
jgi:hypothetical protein